MTTETEKKPEVWMALPKHQLDAILKHLGEMPFGMVAPIAPILLSLNVKQVALNEEKPAPKE